MDISADLMELSRNPVGLVSAGVKSILDIGRTLEYLVDRFSLSRDARELSVCVEPGNSWCPSCRVLENEGLSRVFHS